MKTIYEDLLSGKQFNTLEELKQFSKAEGYLTARWKKIEITEKESYDEEALEFEDKIVFPFREEDFEYSRGYEDVAETVIYHINQKLKEKGVNIQMILDADYT